MKKEKLSRNIVVGLFLAILVFFVILHIVSYKPVAVVKNVFEQDTLQVQIDSLSLPVDSAEVEK